MHRPQSRRRFMQLGAALSLAACMPRRSFAQDTARPRVAVIFPQMREPYRTVFRSIAEGIAAASAYSDAYEITANEDIAALEQRLASRSPDAVILLGKRGLDLSHTMKIDARRIVGAVFAQPEDIAEGVSVVSLAPSPRLLFAKLRELAPRVRRIHVIYGADSNDWLIDRARHDAAATGYELVAQYTNNIREGANAYRQLLATMRSPEDALWLLQASPFIDEVAILQLVLRTAWERNFIVFSSNPSHVPKGALFALFPNDVALGGQLAAVASAAPTAATRLQPLEQLNTAINIRTADHLGLGLDARNPGFDMVFPNQR